MAQLYVTWLIPKVEDWLRNANTCNARNLKLEFCLTASMCHSACPPACPSSSLTYVYATLYVVHVHFCWNVSQLVSTSESVGPLGGIGRS